MKSNDGCWKRYGGPTEEKIRWRQKWTVNRQWWRSLRVYSMGTRSIDTNYRPRRYRARGNRSQNGRWTGKTSSTNEKCQSRATLRSALERQYCCTKKMSTNVRPLEAAAKRFTRQAMPRKVVPLSSLYQCYRKPGPKLYIMPCKIPK